MRKFSGKAAEIEITPFYVMEVLERAQQLAAQGKKVIHMEVGEPDFDTPEIVVKAGIEALREGKTRYSHSLGILPLRESISRKYQREYGVNISPDRILITSGSSAAMTLLFSLTLQEGDEVLLTDPYYACFPNFIRLYGAVPKFVPLYEEKGWRLYPEDIKKALTPKTKAIIVNSPANPTGQLCPDELYEFLAQQDIYIFSDEIYHGLVYGKRAKSALEFTDDAFVISGFSKLYAMTGWRLGYIIAPFELVRLLQKGHQNFFIAANTFVQWGGVAAIEKTQADVEKMVNEFYIRRDILISELDKIGLKPDYIPDGAFYLLVNFEHIGENSLELAFDILEKTGVALAPGIDFGSQASKYLRFSYATSAQNIKDAVSRIGEYIKNR